MTFKKIILAVSLIELIVIVILTINFYRNKNHVLGTKVSINPIEKQDLIFSEAGDLKHFYEPKPNIIKSKKAEWLPVGYDYTITINADSLNERFDYSADKPQDVFRIIALGDSFTYGEYVNTKDNYPEQLEDLLNNFSSCLNIKKFEVINLGVGGYDIEYAVTRFKKHGVKYSPDLILWLLKNDDIYEIKEQISAKSEEYRKEMVESGELKKYEEKGMFYIYNVKASEDVAKIFGKEKVLEYQFAALKSLWTIYKNPLLVLSFPTRLNKEEQEFIEKFINESSNAYFYGQLPVPVNPDTALPDGHPNKEGYSLFANNIFRYLTDNHLIPCN